MILRPIYKHSVLHKQNRVFFQYSFEHANKLTGAALRLLFTKQMLLLRHQNRSHQLYTNKLTNNLQYYHRPSKIKKVLLMNLYFIYQSMLCVEDQEHINRIVDNNLQTLREGLEKFAYSALRKAKANHFHHPFELIQNRISYFSKTIAQRQLQEIAAAIFQAQEEQKSQELKLIGSQKLGQEMEEENLQNEMEKHNERFQSEVDMSERDLVLNEFPLYQQKVFIENKELLIVEQLNIDAEEQQMQIKKCKMAKAITMDQSLNKLLSFYYMTQNDLAEPFEDQQNEEVNALLQFLKQQFKSKLIDEQILKSTAIVQYIGQLNAMEFEIDGQLKSALFFQFYNQKNSIKKIQEYKISFGGRQIFSYFNRKPNILPLKEEQIFAKVIKLSSQELNQLKNQFTEWGKRLQKLTWENERICFSHRRKTHYLCENEIMKGKVYLCNRCVSDEEQSQQKNREIVCKRHRKPIKCKLSPKLDRVSQLQQKPEEQEQHQTFMCEQCLFYNHQQYDLVCCSHYQPITELCIQQHCAEIGEFMICQICLKSSNNKHEHHRKVKFDRESLMKQFGLQDTINISVYEKELIKTKEMLKLNPLQKIRISFAEQTISTIRFLESFAVYDEAKVSEWINVFMSWGQREDLMVLRGVQNIKQELLSESKKLSYLEAVNYLLQGELSAMFEGVWQRIFHSCERINKLKNTNKSQVIAQLNKKYEQISDIETDDGIIAFPMRLSDVNPIHRSRIQRITVVKGSEAQRDDKIRKEFRDKRGKFFKQQIRRKLIEAQAGAQQQRQIIQLFSKAKDYQLGSLADKLEEQNTLYKYRTTIQSLSQKYEQIQDQFAAKLGECLPWSLIVSNEFSSLRVLRIQYAPKYGPWIEEYFYSIDAFALFGFINGNAQLESVTLKGVKIQNMQQFVETLNPNNPDPYSMRKKEERKWLKARRPWANLRLTLQSAYQLYPYISYFNASTFAFRLSALSYFRRQFQSLSDMTVAIWFKGEKWGGHLEELLQCLRAIKEIKIEIHSIHKPFLLLPLLKGLSSFTEITSLAFQRIQLQPQKSGAQFPKDKEQSFDSQDQFSSSVSAAAVSAMEESLSLLFKGNAVAHLRLYRCYIFPALPRITTLRSIDLFNVSFWGEFVKANRQLRLISIQPKIRKQYRCEIGEETLNQLQCLRVGIRQNGVCFGPISSPSPSKLKCLSIINYNRIDANSLKPIFAKLAHLTQLKLWRFDFGYQLLSAIPSNNLEELIGLFDCPQISERMLRLCKFKGLMQIRVDRGVLSAQGRKYLRGRGIRVDYYLLGSPL